MNKKLRMAIMIVTSMLAAATIIWLQGKYEAGDQRNALTVVQNYRSRAGVSIPEALTYRHPGKAVQWNTTVESSCFQHIRVDALVSEDPAARPLDYKFTVDINGPSIHPANGRGKEILGLIEKPLPVAASATATP